MSILITGGCGFIGANAVRYFANKGHDVHLFDNLSRNGSEANLAWIRDHFDVSFTEGDIRDEEGVNQAFQQAGPDAVIHLAGQVAVTTSTKDPRHDFDVNAKGTFNILEAVREHCPEAVVINASTNKVYGAIDDREVVEREQRYRFGGDLDGIDERQALDFHSPYGCSKGAADQYMEDYHKIYGLRTVNFRQSCIYGPRQFGMEAQGWIAWFIIAHLTDQPITIYGTGKQVRDVLYVDDLVEAYDRVIQNIDQVAGESFNVGGGNEKSVSILEFMDVLGDISGQPVSFEQGEWRPGDQKVYISDTEKITQALGWEPTTSVEAGIEQLYDWVRENKELVSRYEGVK